MFRIWRYILSNLRTRAISAYLLFSVVLLVVVGTQIYMSKLDRIEVAKNSIVNYLAINERALSAAFSAIDAILHRVAEDCKSEPKLLSTYSLDTLRKSQEFLSPLGHVDFRIVGQDGEVLRSTDGLKFSVKDRDFFISLKERIRGDITVSEPLRPKKMKAEWIVVFARRINSADGSFLGVVQATIDVGLFASFEREFHLGKGSLFAVVTGPKKYFAYRNTKKDEVTGKPFKYHPALEEVVSRKKEAAVHETVSVNDGVKRLTGVTWVQGLDVLVVIGKNYDEVLASWKAESAAYLLTVALLILVGYFGFRMVLHQNQKILTQQAKLVSSSKYVALGEMAGGVAHEINNPMAIIIGKAGILRRKLEKGELDPVKALVDLEKIEKTGERVAKIVKGLRMFSRNAEGDPMRPENIRQVVEDTLELCAEKFKNRGVDLRVNLGEISSLKLNCRAVQISQLLLNLLNNAFDAVEKLDERWVELAIRTNESKVQVLITDSGQGIPTEIVDKIMHPFFTTKELGKGTGLGLSISRGIAEDHDGQLRYEIASGHTCFVVELPLSSDSDDTGPSNSKRDHAA